MMSQATLSTQLQNLTPTDSEAAAITVLVDAYGVYASDATGNGVALSVDGVNLGKAAMAPVLVGMSTDGLTKVPNAIVAFWAAVCGDFETSFENATAATPPPQTDLTADFATACSENLQAEASLVDACNSIAAVFHTQAITDGKVTIDGSGEGPIL